MADRWDEVIARGDRIAEEQRRQWVTLIARMDERFERTQAELEDARERDREMLREMRESRRTMFREMRESREEARAQREALFRMIDRLGPSPGAGPAA